MEALKMVGFRLSPITLEDAKKLIHETLPPALIKGVRGRGPMNADSIAGVLVSLGQLLEEQPQIEEVDFNPVFPYQDGCMAVDARIIISKVQVRAKLQKAATMARGRRFAHTGLLLQ